MTVQSLLTSNRLVSFCFEVTSSEIFVLTEEGKGLIQTLASTPIISRDYDPDCMVSYVAGLIRRMKMMEGLGKCDFLSLHLLMRDGDCIDKGVITEIIDAGFHASSYEGALDVAKLLGFMSSADSGVQSYDYGLQSDTHTAFAIRSGLIEMVLDLIEQFGIEDTSELSHHIDGIFQDVYDLSLQKKTAKAIRSKRNKIEEKLDQLECDIEVAKHDQCMKLFDTMREILGRNGAYCCRCNKPLGRKDRKQCGGCNRMTYCSVACQKDDWLDGGHKLSCCKQFSNETAGRYQGRLKPKITPEDDRAASKVDELEINITMIQLKLFLDSSKTILRQASALGLPLHDCVVEFDLRDDLPFTFTVRTMKYTEFYNTPEARKGFEDSRSKENITCIYYSWIFNGELEEDLTYSGYTFPLLSIQRLLPHNWLLK